MARQTQIVDIRGAMLFPFPFLLLGAGFILAGLGVMINHPLIALILIGVGVSVVTAYEGTEIDLANHTWREYNAILFLKKGKPRRYEVIEKLYINSGKVSQRVYTAHTTSSTTFSNTEYNAYLKIDSEKVFLFSGRNKKKMVRRGRAIAGMLHTAFQDNSVTR